MENIEEKIMRTAVKVDTSSFLDLNAVVSFLEKQLLEGKNVYCEFNRKKLYSILDDRDSCYLKVTGKTYEEYEKAQREWLENYNKEQERKAKEAEEKVPYWIERGNAIISEDLQGEWAKCVKIRSTDLYHGMELDASLEVMELLAQGGSFEKANQMLDEQGHSGMSYSITRSIIMSFSPRGKELFDYVNSANKEME